MTQTLEIRSKPKLKFVLDKNEFEIMDAADQKNSGIYLFKYLKNVDLKEKRTDWLISTLSWIADLFTGDIGVGGNYKNKANLKIYLVNRTIKIWLSDEDVENAEKTRQLLLQRKTYTYQ